jgi:protein-disulfide isomerase
MTLVATNRVGMDRGSRNRQWLLIGGGALLLLIVAVVAYLYWPRGLDIQASGTLTGTQAANPERTAELMVPGPLGEITLGDPKAPNTIIEYASLTCPHCKAWSAEVYPALKAKYIDTGKVYFILREFPRDPVDVMAFTIARCVPGRTMPLIELMFAEQANWAYVSDPKSALQNLVKQAGISQDQFSTCLTNQSLLDGVQASLARATKTFNVGATPTFFINGVKVEGEQPLVAVEKRLVGLTS